MKNRGK